MSTEDHKERRAWPADLRSPPSGPAFVELATATAFSFLKGASHPHEMVGQAWALGHAAAAVADVNTLAGVVRAHRTAKDLSETLDQPEGSVPAFRLCVGARLSFACGSPDVLVYPSDREAYARLTRLLTRGGMEAGVKRGEGAHLVWADLLAFAQGQNLILMPPDLPEAEGLARSLQELSEASEGRAWMAGVRRYDAVDQARLDLCAETALAAGVPLIAVNDAVIHDPARKRLHDVMSCIREHVTLYEAGRRLEANAEQRLKTAAEMASLFRDHPVAVQETVRFAGLCDFTLDELSYVYPDEPVPKGRTATQHLRDLSWAGAKDRYGLPSWKVKRQLVTELKFIRRMEYEHYFLTVHDIVHAARGMGVLCQGRGSAANSIVCYALKVTAVDPILHKLLFSRFISDNRNEPPDIDIDFEHERREDVIQYIYKRYTRQRAAICATVIHYRPRMAIREVGKVFGLTEDLTSSLASTIWGSWGDALPPEYVRQAGHDPEDHVLKEVIELANELIAFPRHLSQHVGGFVLTQRRLDEICPIVNAAMPDRTFIEWDKDDIDVLGILKVDVLALGMLTAIKKAFGLLEAEGVLGQGFDMADIPAEQVDVYRMCAQGDTIGVFQIESRAQMNMLPRLKPEKFYDLVIEVAIVRPGPIQGDMVHPYLRRKSGLEPIEYPEPGEGFPKNELRDVLNETLGVPLFQEQVMKVAMVAAEFTGAEADQLRRAMATFKRAGGMGRFHEKLITGMAKRGYSDRFAQAIFKQIEGFGSYGFPESHAASFAKLVYVSAWLKCRFPAAFCAALLNSQPMGFYAPAQIVRDAHEHGVEIRPPDVDHSDWDCTLEYDAQGVMAVRLGLRLIDGLPKALGERIAQQRGPGYGDFDSFMRKTQLTRAQVRRLAQADAFASFGMNRRSGLWQALKTSAKADAPLVDALPRYKPPPPLPLLSQSEEVVADYQTTRLSLKGHPMTFVRAVFAAEGVRPCGDLVRMRDKDKASVAGVVLVRQRPGNGKVCFITVEDEGGVANLVVVEPVFEKHRAIIMGSRLLVAHGHVQKSPEGVTHLFVERLEDRSHELGRLTEDGEQAGEPGFEPPIAPSDHVKTNGPTGGAGVRMTSLKAPDARSPQRLDADREEARRIKSYCSAKPGGQHPRDVRIISRDFH